MAGNPKTQPLLRSVHPVASAFAGDSMAINYTRGGRPLTNYRVPKAPTESPAPKSKKEKQKGKKKQKE